MHIKVNDTTSVEALRKALATLDTEIKKTNLTNQIAESLQCERTYVVALIQNKTKKVHENQTLRFRQLAGLAPLVEAWDPDDLDRYANPDNGFGVGRNTDRMATAPTAGAPGDDEDAIARRRLGVRPPHVGGKEGMVAAKKGPPRRLTSKTVDPEIARQLAGDEGDDMDVAADAAAPRPAVSRSAAPPTTSTSGDDFGTALAIDPMAATMANGMPTSSVSYNPAPTSNPIAASAPAAVSVKGAKSGAALKYLQDNPSVTRGQFMKWATTIGMGPHYANTFLYSPKVKTFRAALAAGDKASASQAAAAIVGGGPEVMEFWVVENEKGKVLAEGTSYDIPTWTPFDQVGISDPKIFESELYAKKAVQSLSKYGFSKVKIVRESVALCEEKVADFEVAKDTLQRLKHKRSNMGGRGADGYEEISKQIKELEDRLGHSDTLGNHKRYKSVDEPFHTKEKK